MPNKKASKTNKLHSKTISIYATSWVVIFVNGRLRSASPPLEEGEPASSSLFRPIFSIKSSSVILDSSSSFLNFLFSRVRFMASTTRRKRCGAAATESRRERAARSWRWRAAAGGAEPAWGLAVAVSERGSGARRRPSSGRRSIDVRGRWRGREV